MAAFNLFLVRAFFNITISSLFVNYFNSCSDDFTSFPWVICKWIRTKGRDQQTDLKTEYSYYSCLHEVTFLKSPYEFSNSKLVHQQTTIKQLFKLYTIIISTQFF